LEPLGYEKLKIVVSSAFDEQGCDLEMSDIDISQIILLNK